MQHDLTAARKNARTDEDAAAIAWVQVEMERLLRLEAAAKAYCAAIDEIGDSGEPPTEHVERLELLEYAMRATLAQPQ